MYAQAADIKDGQKLDTRLGGGQIKAQVAGAAVTVGAGNSTGKVITPDVPAGVSIVHIVDGVIAPNSTVLKKAVAAAAKAKEGAAAGGDAGPAGPVQRPDAGARRRRGGRRRRR